jgi:hypothetical protein
MPADKQPLEAQIRELYPNAPFMPADLQNVIPHAGQVGPIVGVAPPIPGYICKVCKRGYRRSGTYPHWRDKHRDIARPPGIEALFDPVPQMQSLSLHNNLIRYFAITPGEAVLDQASPLATSDDMTLLNALQEVAFGPDEEATELNLDAVQAFFNNSGATEHVKGFPTSELLRLVELPCQDEPKLVKLRRAQYLRFEAHSKRVFIGNVALRRLIAITKPYVTLTTSLVLRYCLRLLSVMQWSIY